jgi:hypothetical protein
MTRLRSPLAFAAIALTAIASIFLYRTISASDVTPARDLAVTCGADHRAVVREIAGQHSVAVDCVPALSGAVADSLAVSQADLAALVAAQAAPAYLMPAVYTPQPQIARVVPPPSAPRTVTSRVRTAPARRIEQKPSWQTRALVIGGTAGAGAGVGALIGGKKGALIGAAVGGGGATVVDLLRNR